MMRWWEGERRKKSKKNIRNISNMAQRALERILIVFKYLLPELFKFHSCPSESSASLNTRELKISSVNNTFTSSIGAVWVRPKERWRWKMQSPVLDSRKRFKLTFLLSKISSDDATRASVSRSCKREKNIISSIFKLVKWGKDLWLMTMTRLDVSMWKQRFHFSWNLVCGWIWQVKPSSTDEKQFPLNEAYRSLSSFDRAPNSISVREEPCMHERRKMMEY